MNKEWSELNKRMQVQLRKEQTFSDGIETLIALRRKVMDEMLRMKRELLTEDFSRMLTFRDMKRKFDEEDKGRLRSLEVVSTDEHASWLIDYWCEKDVRGLVQMPFSRHWIMHVEASLRIENNLHAFLAENIRDYNTVSTEASHISV